MYIDSSASCACEMDPLTSKCLARCALLFLAASTGRTLSSGAFSGNSGQLWMEASSAGSWGGRSLGLPVLLSDSRLDASPPPPPPPPFFFLGFRGTLWVASRVPSALSPRSPSCQGWFLLGPLPLACGWLPSRSSCGLGYVCVC